jgi:hypothetical protein
MSAPLRSCRVELIGRVEAVALILKFEPLGHMGQARLFFGLRAPDDRLLGACGFGRGINRFGACAVLERGFCVPNAPRTCSTCAVRMAAKSCPTRQIVLGMYATCCLRFPDTQHASDELGRMLHGLDDRRRLFTHTLADA